MNRLTFTDAVDTARIERALYNQGMLDIPLLDNRSQPQPGQCI